MISPLIVEDSKVLMASREKAKLLNSSLQIWANFWYSVLVVSLFLFLLFSLLLYLSVYQIIIEIMLVSFGVSFPPGAILN